MSLGKVSFSNPSSTQRVCCPKAVIYCERGDVNVGDAITDNRGEWVDWFPNSDENGEDQVWGDGSFREIVCFFREVIIPADSRLELTVDTDANATAPTFQLDTNVAAQLGSFLTNRGSTAGWDLLVDIDPGAARSDPKSIQSDGALVQLVDGANVKAWRWQVRSGDARHIWTGFVEVYSGVPFALWDTMESFSTPSTTDWLDNMTVGWRASGTDCWPIFHQESLRVEAASQGSGSFASWNRDYGGSGNVLHGQGCGFRMELWFRDPTTIGTWSQLEQDTYNAMLEHPRVWGVSDRWRVLDAYGPRGRVPDPPPQFASFAAMQAAERVRAKNEAQQGVSHPQNTGAFYHDVIGGNVQPRDTASDLVHGHGRAYSVVMSDEPTFLERIANAVTQENCRPGWNYEDGSLAGTRDGDIVSNTTRPTILLWEGVPFVTVFLDTFGKPQGADPPRGSARRGWAGLAFKAWAFWDRQHYSATNVVALASLTGDWIAKHQIAHHREHLRSQQPPLNFRAFNVFAAFFEASREVGRCIRSAAWLERHFPQQSFRAHIKRRIESSLSQGGLAIRNTFGRQFTNFETSWDFAAQLVPHELTSIEHDDSTLNMPVPNTARAPEATGILYWQEGIMADGLMSWWSATNGTPEATPRAFDLALQTSENCSLYGFFEDTQFVNGGAGAPNGGLYNVYHALRMSGDANRPDASLLPPNTLYTTPGPRGGGRGPAIASSQVPAEYVEYRVYFETPRWAIPCAMFAYEYSPDLAIRRQAARILKGYFVTYRGLPAPNRWHDYGDTDMAWVPTAGFDPWTEDYDAVIGGNPTGGGGPVVVPDPPNPHEGPTRSPGDPPDPFNPGGTSTGITNGMNETYPEPYDPPIVYPSGGTFSEVDPDPDPPIIGGTSTGISASEVDPNPDPPITTGSGGGGSGVTSETAPDTEPSGSTGGGGGNPSGPGYPSVGEFEPEPNPSGSGGANPGGQPAGICSIAMWGAFTDTHQFTVYVHSVGCYDVGVTVLGPSGYSESASLIGVNVFKVNLLGRGPGIYYVTADCNDDGETCDPVTLSFSYIPPMSSATALWAATRATYASDGLLQLTNPNNRKATAINDTVGEQAAQRVINLWSSTHRLHTTRTMPATWTLASRRSFGRCTTRGQRPRGSLR